MRRRISLLDNVQFHINIYFWSKEGYINYLTCAEYCSSFFAYCFTGLRAELSLLKTHLEAQAKELSQRKHQIKELEEKERVANESVHTFPTWAYV